MDSRELELANDFNESFNNSWICFGSNILKYVNEYGFSDVSSLVSLIRNLDGRYLTLVARDVNPEEINGYVMIRNEVVKTYDLRLEQLT